MPDDQGTDVPVVVGSLVLGILMVIGGVALLSAVAKNYSSPEEVPAPTEQKPEEVPPTEEELTPVEPELSQNETKEEKEWSCYRCGCEWRNPVCLHCKRCYGDAGDGFCYDCT